MSRDDYILYSIKVGLRYYVGSTLKISERIHYHMSRCYNSKCKDYNMPLYKYIRKNNLNFTKDNFTVEILLLDCTNEHARKCERKLLEEFEGDGKIMLNEYRPYTSPEEREKENKEFRQVYYKERYENDPEYRERLNETRIERRKDPEYRARENFLKRESRAKKRANETPEEREERLRKDRERDKKRRLLPQNKS